MTDKTEITHDLIKPFNYTPKNSGEEVEAQFVALPEPSVNQLLACSTLKQAFMRVIANNAQDDEAPSDTPEDSSVPMHERIINALYASSDTDMGKLLLSAKELFKSVGLLDGEKKMTAVLVDSLCIQDLEQMTGKYMENFILASVLEGQ